MGTASLTGIHHCTSCIFLWILECQNAALSQNGDSVVNGDSSLYQLYLPLDTEPCGYTALSQNGQSVFRGALSQNGDNVFSGVLPRHQLHLPRVIDVSDQV